METEPCWTYLILPLLPPYLFLLPVVGSDLGGKMVMLCSKMIIYLQLHEDRVVWKSSTHRGGLSSTSVCQVPAAGFIFTNASPRCNFPLLHLLWLIFMSSGTVFIIIMISVQLSGYCCVHCVWQHQLIYGDITASPYLTTAMQTPSNTLRGVLTLQQSISVLKSWELCRKENYRSPRHEHISPCPSHTLHRLPVCYRIDFKNVDICF